MCLYLQGLYAIGVRELRRTMRDSNHGRHATHLLKGEGIYSIIMYPDTAIFGLGTDRTAHAQALMVAYEWVDNGWNFFFLRRI
jgi:hypothetical protein